MVVEPYDDVDILDEDLLIRRIDPRQHLVPDENRGGLRLSTKAFCESSEGSKGMSIDLRRQIEEDGIDPRKYVTDPKYLGAVEFPARVPRERELVVGKEPLPKNPYHGEVWRVGNTARFSPGQKKAILAAARWLVPISDVPLGD